MREREREVVVVVTCEEERTGEEMEGIEAAPGRKEPEAGRLLRAQIGAVGTSPLESRAVAAAAVP